MKNILTDRQQDILNFISEFRNANGFPPTLREIGKQFGITSTFGVKRHLDALVKKGYLTIESNASRGLNLIKDENNVKVISDEESRLFAQVPIVGRVAAGLPITADENIEGNLILDKNFLKSFQDCFALKVKGDSMINAGIFEGDFVIIHRQTNAKNDDIVVAIIENDTTLKRYYKKNDEVKLIPENEKYQPIEINKNETFHIEGKVVGVVRWYN